MPYCSRCGVEVDRIVDRCPLCEAPIQKLPADDGSPWPAEEAPAPASPPRSTDEKIALAKTITTLGFLIPVSIVLTVDWFVSRRLSWSLYVLASLGAAWLWALLPFVLSRSAHGLIWAVTGVAVALEWALGLLAGDIGWILTVGMPIVVGAGGLAALVTLLARCTRKAGTALAGWILIALGILSVATDVLVNAHFAGSWRPGWSLIVAAALAPVAAMLLYLHFRPSRQSRLRRYFHV